jgi:ATP-dependent DNA helicase RecQ
MLSSATMSFDLFAESFPLGEDRTAAAPPPARVLPDKAARTAPSDPMAKADLLLKSVFGFDGYRSFQREIIESVLRGDDVLAVLPTGGGKSLCYQLPSLVIPGYALVVSPLIALMRDQLDALVQLGIPAVFLNSSLSPEEYRASCARIRSGEVRLVYAAPEGLSSDRFLESLDANPPSLLVVDEAHCISQWGHDFRPEYRRISSLRRKYPAISCLAVTATAPERVREDIALNLELRKPAVFVAGFDRPNLHLSVEPRLRAKERILELARAHPGESGIVYCLSRAKTEDFASWLLSQGIPAGAYHAGLGKEERDATQRAFIRDDIQIVVATVAFGMGIDKPDVRWIVHADLPKAMESYYQEIGRAGRDGLPATCLLLYSRGDAFRSRMLFSELEGEQLEDAMSRIDEMVQYAEIASCRRRFVLAHFGDSMPGLSCGACDNCLRKPEDLADYTIPALKLLSCAIRTQERYGAGHLVDVLLGERGERVLRLGHDRVSTFGIGTDLDRASWMELARRMLSEGYMERADELSGLTLSARGRELLRTRGPYHALPLSPARLVKRKKTEADAKAGVSGSGQAPEGRARIPGQIRPSLEGENERLFQLLRCKRKELANSAGVPPYVIFPDRTLEELARVRPRNRAAMMDIFGIGEAKLGRYGGEFLSLILAFADAPGRE